MINFINPTNVIGLPAFEYAQLMKLVNVFTAHQGKNEQKNRYYEGKISLNSVNLGIALPDGLARLEIGCAWGAKAVYLP